MTASAAPATPARPGSFAHASVGARLTGVLVSPRQTFQALVAAPRALDVLLLWFIPFLATAALFSTEVGRFALVDHWERTAIAFGQDIGDAEYAALQQAAGYGVVYTALTTAASGPLLAVVLALVIFVALRRSVPAVRYQQVLSITAHASVILAIRQLLAAPVSYARESISSPASASLLLTMADEGSALTRLAGLIDLFVLWWVVVLAIGVSVVYGRSARRIVLIFAGIYVGIALVLAVVMAALGAS